MNLDEKFKQAAGALTALELLSVGHCLAVTEDILDEYHALATRIGRRECPDKDPTPFLDWIERVALLMEPSPLGKRRSRDSKDDPFLACALASRAEFIITKDKDLLALEKPFGVEIVAPTPQPAREASGRQPIDPRPYNSVSSVRSCSMQLLS